MTQKAHLIAEAQQQAAGLHEVDTGLQRSQSQRLDWQQRWQAVWQPLGIEPATPREMLAWSQRHTHLAARAASLRDQQRDVSRLENELHAIRAMLSACLGQLGEPACGDNEPLACVLQRGEELVAQIQTAHDQRHARTQKRDELGEALAAAELTIQEANQRFRTWQQAWDGCVRRITVSETAGPAEVNAALDAITELQQQLTETDDLRQRIDGIDRDAAAFRAATRQLVDLAAPDLAALPADQAASDLQDRLRAAQQAHARRQELETQREIEVNKHAKAGDQIAQLQAELERMCREAHCSAARTASGRTAVAREAHAAARAAPGPGPVGPARRWRCRGRSDRRRRTGRRRPVAANTQPDRGPNPTTPERSERTMGHDR